jgi:hypothetical protein
MQRFLYIWCFFVCDVLVGLVWMGNYMFIDYEGVNDMNLKFQLTRAFIISLVSLVAFSLVAILIRADMIMDLFRSKRHRSTSIPRVFVPHEGNGVFYSGWFNTSSSRIMFIDYLFSL